MMCQRKEAVLLKVIPIDENGEVIIDEYLRLLSDRTKLVAVTQVSNALGVVLPVHKIIDAAHENGVPVLIDGEQ